MNLFVLFGLTYISLFVSLGSAGYCPENYTCQGTCYYKERYKSKCGAFGWRRCTRYRQKTRSCSKTCTRQVCCKDFTGSGCTTPLCFGSTTCPNGGTCRSPNNCDCKTGYASPKCDDINECATSASGCSQICTNTPGSFKCSCRSGYVLDTDLKSCVDVNECDTSNGQCEQTCINEPGTSRCDCRPGYKLNGDGRTCSDIDECATGTSGCDQTCTNTVGSYTCSCRQGYDLDIDGHKCTDVDECSSGAARCNQNCHNTQGSYTCSCREGYFLGTNGHMCTDKDECLDENGLCEQICDNVPGSHTCSCITGYELMADQRSCKDIDECALKIDGCAQICTNDVGSFTCSCRVGYEITGKSCTDIDDCAGASCENGGVCVDELNAFKCVCQPGFTGDLCEEDIDECSFLNGGCQDICINDPGTFHCSCSGNKTMGTDGKTCTGVDPKDNVFRRHKLARQLLPKGCASLLLTRCKDGNAIDVHLSSTSDWYRLNSDHSIIFTKGIVFVEVNTLSLPISLNGVEVTQTQDDFTISLGTNGRSDTDGQPLPVTRTDDCISFEFTASDIFEFVSSVSFLKTFFDKLVVALPPWLGFSSTSFSALDVSDIKTDLVYGHAMDEVTWCEGAPVIPSHVYSVFRFSSEFSLSLYGNQINLPKPLNGKKFCLIVDICHSYGGSIFLMLPDESRDLLSGLDVFKKLEQSQGLSIRPRGVGLSLVRGVNVHYQETALQLWNGDTKFTYPVFDRASLWIGGDVTKNSKTLQVQGRGDLFVSVPNLTRMLTAIFIDEWNILAQIKASATPILSFKLFKKQHNIAFVDLARASVDVYMSIGGTHERQWCGEVANPPGVFLSGILSINPFQTVPILKDWIVDIPSKLYAFFTTDPSSKITDDMKIDILKDIIQVKDILKRFKVFLNTTVSSFETILTQTTNAIIDKIYSVLGKFENSIDDVIRELGTGNVLAIIDLLSALWDELRELESTVRDFRDETEDFVDETKDKFTNLIKNETAIIKSNLNKAITKVRSQVISAAKDYSGFGLKFTAGLNFLGLKILGVDIELVHSVDSLMQCSRFDKVKQLLAGEKAVRVLGRLSRGIKLGYFLKLDAGAGIGGALSIDTDKFLLQMSAYVSMLGIRVTGDVFIGKSGVYFYVEGNVWGIFLAQIEVSAETGKEWYQLTFTLKGRFVAKARKRRQVQTVSTSFDASYLDALKKVVQRISEEAEKRLSQAQDFLSSAQNGLTKAQNWLEDKKDDVRKANRHFDNAVSALGRAKDKLEAAKGPFQRAIEKLNSAQRKVDKICKIKSCSKICVPGIKCKICHKKVWGVRIPYPCCRFTSCMFKLPNPICEAANLVCRGIRALAFVALEAAKLFVRIPMAALDLAKAALSVAQFAVDKSRIVLDAAEGLLNLAKLGLEGAKFALETAKQGLELVKRAIGVAAKILELVIEYGLKSLVDVRNCGFEVELSTTDLPVFDVSCEVNAFRLGWRKVGLRINFKNILQSIWQAAKATIDALKGSLTSLIKGRKRREIGFDTSERLHVLLRNIRQAGPENLNTTNDFLNDTLHIVNETLGFNNGVMSDHENRIMLYKQKCKEFGTASAFLGEIFGLLFDIVNETNAQINSLTDIDAELDNYTTANLENTVGLMSAGIDTDYLTTNYNVTMEQIYDALNETKSSFKNDTFINELSNMALISKQLTQSNIEAVRSDQILASWAVAIGNGTQHFFTDNQCTDFSDCTFFAITTLYEIHLEETYDNINESKAIISQLESDVLKVMNNSGLNISEIFKLSTSVLSGIQRLETIIPFCKSPPVFVEEPANVTALVGGSATFYCRTTSPDSDIQYSWYANGEMLLNQTLQNLRIHDVGADVQGYYECVASNVVASVTSRRAYLTVTSKIDDYPQLLKEECRKHGCNDLFACYVPHPQTCSKFILCRSLQSGNYLAHVMECGFGTMWKNIMNTAQICERAEKVDCEIDPCKDPSTKSYDHVDDNLRTYWQCINNRSVAECCPHHHRYDIYLKKCVEDINSTQTCALRNDDSCTGNNVKAIDYADGNCRTYLECINGHPHPVCCPSNKEYDVFQSKCVTSTSGCTDVCPDNFTDICSYKNVSSYEIEPANCRTYMKCKKAVPGNVDEPFCCPKGQEYDLVTRACALTTNQSCLNETCPTGYTIDCSLESVDSSGKSYIDTRTQTVQHCPESTRFDRDQCYCVHTNNHSTDCSDTYKAVPGRPSEYLVRDHGWTVRQCAPGTVFDPRDCVCKFGSQLDISIPKKECQDEIHVKLPIIENLGTALAVVMTIKDDVHVVSRHGNMSEVWSGSDGVNIPFYSLQKLSSFYIEVTIKPLEPGPGYKQIILSSCQTMEGTALVDGLPTLELALMRFSNDSGVFKLQVRSSDIQDMVEIDTPFMFNRTYTYRMIYDGEILALQQLAGEVQTIDTCAPTMQTGKHLNVINDFRKFKGKIDIGAGGLRFARCESQPGITSFKGTVREIKFSRCLPASIATVFKDIQTCKTDWRTIWNARNNPV